MGNVQFEQMPPSTYPDRRHDSAHRRRRVRRRSSPLPLWSKGGIAVGVTLALLAAFLTRTLLQRGDWSDGALAVTLAAGLLALITIGIGLLRAMAGRRSAWTVLQTGLLAWLLLAVALATFTVMPSLHAVQANNALKQGRWAEAIDEFALSGEHAPNAPDIARSLLGWGKDDLARKAYASAASKLAAVSTYASADLAVAVQAQQQLYTTYVQWMRADPGAVTYGGTGGALATFQAYQTTAACDAACTTQMPTLLAQSYLQLGRQQIAAKSCAAAISSYQTLVKDYPNSTEAATAQAALAAPQSVVGSFSGLPDNPTPTVALSKSVNVSGLVFSDEYTAAPDASGAFSIGNVALGNYNLSTRREVNGAVSYTYYHDTTGNLYTVHVTPLCPAHLGVIAYK